MPFPSENELTILKIIIWWNIEYIYRTFSSFQQTKTAYKWTWCVWGEATNKELSKRIVPVQENINFRVTEPDQKTERSVNACFPAWMHQNMYFSDIWQPPMLHLKKRNSVVCVCVCSYLSTSAFSTSARPSGTAFLLECFSQASHEFLIFS